LFIKKFIGLSSVSAKIQTKLAVAEDSIYRRQNNRYSNTCFSWYSVEQSGNIHLPITF